ncbi:MAG: hypothetical protein RLZZ127_3103, partial [Planctomycetota bacterium]
MTGFNQAAPFSAQPLAVTARVLEAADRGLAPVRGLAITWGQTDGSREASLLPLWSMSPRIAIQDSQTVILTTRSADAFPHPHRNDGGIRSPMHRCLSKPEPSAHSRAQAPRSRVAWHGFDPEGLQRVQPDIHRRRAKIRIMHRSVTAVMVVCGLVGLDAPPAAALDRDAWIFPATPSAGPRISQSRGDQKVLVISIETADQLVPAGTWPPTATRARQIAEELNRDFMAASYGRMGLTFIYVPEVIRIPGVKADYRFFAWETYPATTIAKTLDARYDLAQVDRVWLVNNLNRCGTGCAYIGGKEFGNNLARDGVARHEINHTNGLNHGGSFSPVDGNPYDTSVFLDNVGDDIGAVHMRAGTRYHLRWQIDNDPQGFGPRAVSSSAAAAGLHALVDVASGEPTPGQFRGLRFPRMVPAGSTWPASGFQSYMVGFSESDVGIHVQAVADLLPGALDTRTVHGGFLLGQDIS